MTDFNKVKNDLKYIYVNFKNKDLIDEVNRRINDLTKLKLTDIEKYYFLNLILFYRINNQIFDKLCLPYFSNIPLLKYSGFLNKIVHEYLYNKILNDNFNLEDFIQQIKPPINLSIKNEIIKIKDEIIKINTFIDNNNYLNKIYNSCEINKNVKINFHDIDYKFVDKIIIKNKGHYQFPQTKYYDENFNLHSYQCYFKAAINFFLNNMLFNKFFIAKDIANEQYNLVEKKLTIDESKLSITSNFINTESMGGADEFLDYKDNAYIELYNHFKNIFQNSINFSENLEENKENSLPDKYKYIEKSYDNYHYEYKNYCVQKFAYCSFYFLAASYKNLFCKRGCKPFFYFRYRFVFFACLFVFFFVFF